MTMWITIGVVIGASWAVMGIGAPAIAQACSCVVATATSLPTDAPTSAKNSTAGQLVLIGVVLIVGAGALVLTLKYRRR